MKVRVIITCICLNINITLAADFTHSLRTESLYQQNHFKSSGASEEALSSFNPDYEYESSIFSSPISIHNLDTNDSVLGETDSKYPLYLTIQDRKDWQYLKEQSYTIFGSCFVLVGLMTLLPESTTGWDSESRDLKNLGSKWEKNVTDGAHRDSDDDFLNYVMHPYFGGVYYTASRHAGFNQYESLFYSFAISTFFWEYGVEAFTERPSYQDLIVTPLFGAIVGEAMLNQEQAILANDGQVLGSETLGDISLFLLNPIGHIHHWVTDAWGEDTDLNLGLTYQPQMVKLNLELRF